MAKQILVHWCTLGVDSVDWAAADEGGALVGDIRYGSLAEAAAAVEGQRCVLIVPGDTVLLTQAQVPGGSAARAQQAVPFVLEEQLADDVDELHFALGAKARDDFYPVAVIGREAMDQISDACQQAGLRPVAIVPEPLALPLPDAAEAMEAGGWVGVLDEGRVVLRLGVSDGAAIDVDMLPLVLQQALAGLSDEATRGLVLYRTGGRGGPGSVGALAQGLTSGGGSTAGQPAGGELDAQALGVPVQWRDCPHVLSLYAAGLSGTLPVNLLQGEYSPRVGFDKAWKPWRATAALALVLLAVLVGSRWLEVRELESQAAALDEARNAVFARALPGVRPVRMDQQMRTALAEIGAGGTGGFTESLNQIAGALATQPQTMLNSLSFRDGRFELDLITDELPTLDALASLIDERGDLALSVQSANRERDGLRSRVRVE